MKPALLLLGSLVLFTPALAAGNHTKGAEPAHISMGAAVALKDYLVPGKTTIFDFTSKYCGPCQAYTQPLALLQTQRADIAVVKVDINRPGVQGIDWSSPVAQQYGMHSIPHFKVYGPDGRLIAEDKLVISPAGQLVSQDSAARIMVDQWIAALK